MTRDEALKLLKYRVKRVQSTTMDEAILLEMKFAQEQILERAVTLPWFLLTEFLSYACREGEERIPLPALDSERTFLAEYEEGTMWVPDDTNPNNPRALIKDEYDAIVAKYPDLGKPQMYSLDGPYFRVRPVPDKEYTLKLLVYLKDKSIPTNPASDGTFENNWLKWAADLLIAETGRVIAFKHLRDMALAEEFKKDADVARARLFTYEEARRHMNREYQMGDD